MNRQKTVFLASAAHELKTPLAVMKGYYDLLLTGSLGKLNDRQREILQESKESCDRLVRLVSMFLNYSALESGKLVLQLRENDLRDCVNDLTCRWQDAFQRAKVRLDVKIHPELPLFKFDYQKVQQCMANLLDNALKHTPTDGCVTLVAEPHFWERRISEAAPSADRRRGRGGRHQQRAGFGFGYRQRNRRRISSGDFRGICACGSLVIGNGPGTGDHQAPDPGASRKSLGG